MIKHLLIVLFFLSFGYTNAQNFKFGKVSEQELAEKLNPLDSTANATVLYKSEKINFDYRRGEGFVQIREIHERIKIYNKEGFDWATKKVRLYNKSSSNSESLQFIKGYTYNLVNGKVEEDKLKNDGIIVASIEQAENSTMLDTFTPDRSKKIAVVFGNEVKGVQQEVVSNSDVCIEIPQLGTKHSLNISVSCGVVLWDLFTKLK